MTTLDRLLWACRLLRRCRARGMTWNAIRDGVDLTLAIKREFQRDENSSR